MTIFQKKNQDAFLKLFIAIFDIVSDRSNLDRGKYIQESSEKLLLTRTRSLFSDIVGDTIFKNADYEVLDETLNDWAGGDPLQKNISRAIGHLMMTYNTNLLAGYAMRTAEEAITHKKSPAMSREKIELLISTFIDHGRREYENRFEYSDDDLSNPARKEGVFCSALTLDKTFLEYALQDKRVIEDFMLAIINNNFALTLKNTRPTMTGTFQTALFGKLANNDCIADRVSADVQFGYCMKLSESAYPDSFDRISEVAQVERG